MHFHFWMRCALAQARQSAMLALAEEGRLGAGKHEGEAVGQRRLCHRAVPRFNEDGQSLVAAFEQSLRPEFSFSRGSRKTARITLRVQFAVLGVLCSKWDAYAARFGAEPFQAYPAGLELVAIGGLDVPTEEL